MAKRTIRIQLNPKLFNPIYFHLEESFANPKIRYIWLYGGSSASKTFSVVQLTIKEMMAQENYNSLVLRKYHVDIKDSIYADFKNIITNWNLGEFFIVQQDYIKCKITGSYVRFRGLDDSEKVKGISGFKKIVMEEISQFEEEDYKQLRKRLRGMANQQIIGIFNPISGEHWIKTSIFDLEELTETKSDVTGQWLSREENTVIFKVNYTDNKYIVGPYYTDQHVIDDFEKDKINDYNYYKIYGLGDWGKLRKGGEFWKDFKTERHVKKNPVTQFPAMFNPELPIHLSWDKNVHPYQPCSVWQYQIIEENGVVKERILRQIDEIALADPLNRVHYVCKEFVKRYPVEIVKGLFIYGDRTAIADDSTVEKGRNFFTQIMDLLKDYHPALRLPGANPSVIQSANFVNDIYRFNYNGISIEIGDNCKKSIHDYQYALEDENGGLSKTTKKNPITGVTYQEFGHLSDCKRYVATMLLAKDYAEHRTKSKSVVMTMGKYTSKNI